MEKADQEEIRKAEKEKIMRIDERNDTFFT
jgi:hypothetical protein